jgi:hypothetical protein
MKNIHIIPTDKPSRLFYNVGGALLFTSYENYNGVNLYITNDEQAKHGDFCLINHEVHYVTKGLSQGRKIILTTDSWCMHHGVQSIDDEFLKWFIENPSCEGVEVTHEVLNPFQSHDKGYILRFPDDDILGEPSKVTFEQAVKPLMKWLSENTHPHTTAIVTGNISELVEGVQVVKTD